MTITAQAAATLFTVEPAPYGSSSIATCSACGDRTRKLGSDRKAIAAIVDHIRAKHPEAATESGL